MKTVISEERSTGMGATRFTAILLDGKFVRISDMPDSRCEGRQAGVEIHEVDVADDAVYASFIAAIEAMKKSRLLEANHSARLTPPGVGLHRKTHRRRASVAVAPNSKVE